MTDTASVLPPPWSPDLASPLLDRSRVLDTVFTPMSVARRNPLVTVAYQELADAMTEVLGGGAPNWCTFSQWPSSSVGALLGIDVPVLGGAIERAFGHGNRGVFCDIGQAYVAFLDTVGVAQPKTLLEAAEAMDACVAALATMRVAPGRPVWTVQATATPLLPGAVAALDPWATDLVQGLSCYALSLVDDARADPSVRAQRIYAGNVLLAAHEQRWLDESLAAGLRMPVRRLLQPHINLRPQRAARLHEVVRPLLDVEEHLLHLLTEHVIAFRFDGRRIPVARPLTGTGPPELDVLLGGDDEAIDPCAREVVARFPRRTHVRCWLSYEQRMGFIAELFRIHHRPDIGHPYGPARVAAIRVEAARIVPPAPAPPTAPDLERLGPVLAAARHHADPCADSVAASLSTVIDGAETLRAAAAAMLDALGAEGSTARLSELVPDLAADNDARWRTLEGQQLIDRETLQRAIAFYRDQLVPINAALLFASLPESYAAAAGVRVLAAGSRLGSSPVRRTGETAQFLLDVLRGGLCTPASRAREALIGVRLFHAIVRRKVAALPGQPAGPWPPVNQEDLLGTMLAFVTPALHVLDRLGIATDRADRDAYARTWCAIGHLLGIEHDLVIERVSGAPRLLSAATADDVAAVIQARHQRRNLDGTWLLEELLEDVGDHFPVGLMHAPDVLLRLLGGERVATTLIASRRSGPLLRAVLRAAVGVFRSPPLRPFVPSLLNAAATTFLEDFVKEGFSSPYMSPRQPVVDPPRHALPLGCADEQPHVLVS